MLFSYDNEQYRTQNAGALQRPAAIMGAPGLVWHRAFWKPAGIPIDRWHNSIDYFLFRVFMHVRDEAKKCGTLEKNFTSSNFDSTSKRFYGFRNSFSANSESWFSQFQQFQTIPDNERFVRHNLFSVRTLLQGLWFTIRASSHNEYWTLSILCDFSDVSPKQLADVGDDVRSICHLYKEMDSYVETRFQSRWSLDEVTTKEAEPEFVSNIRVTLVDRFKTLVLDRILSKCETQFPRRDDISFEAIGAIFAEFYGTVFGVEVKEESKDAAMPPKLSCRPIGDALTNRASPKVIGDYSFPPKTAVHALDAFWPIIDGLHRNQEYEQLYGKPEFTISLLQGRRTIYLSSLGRINPDARATLKEDPVIYTIIASYRSRRQLGRLVERLNTLGTLRLAALRDLQQLTNASDAMRMLERKINVVGSRPSASSIATDFGKLGDGLENGLMYRVDRSRYYVAQFIELVEQLRSEKMEGYQHYKEFVRRKLFDTFDFIDRLGKRYVELRSEYLLLLNSERTDKTVDLQSNIESFTKGMKEQQGKTNLLLQNAEFIIAAPLAYYIGMGVHYVFQLTSHPVSEGDGILIGLVCDVILIAAFQIMRRRNA